MRIIPRKPQTLRTQFLWRDPAQLLRGTLQSFHTLILLAGLVTFGCLLYLWQWMNFLQLSYQVQHLEKDHQKLAVRLEMLRVEVDFLSRPERLETVALDEMHMRLPSQAQLYPSETLFPHETPHP